MINIALRFDVFINDISPLKQHADFHNSDLTLATGTTN